MSASDFITIEASDINVGDAVEVYGIKHWELSYSIPSGTRIKGVCADLEEVQRLLDELVQVPGARFKVRAVEVEEDVPSALELTALADERAREDFMAMAVRSWSKEYCAELWAKNVGEGCMWMGAFASGGLGWVKDGGNPGQLDEYLERWGVHE